MAYVPFALERHKKTADSSQLLRTASHFCFGLCFERRGLPSAVGAHSAHNVAINALDHCAKPARLLIGAAIYAAAIVAWLARESSPEYT